MYCPSCGSEIPDDSQFCSQCGAEIQQAVQQSQSQSQPQPQHEPEHSPTQQESRSPQRDRQQKPQQQPQQGPKNSDIIFADDRVPPEAECDKCGTVIRTDVEKCPQCGYEPGDTGILVNLLAVVGIIGTTFCGLLIAVALLVMATGFPITDGLIVIGFFAALSLPFIGLMYGAGKKEMQMPTGYDKDYRKEFIKEMKENMD